VTNRAAITEPREIAQLLRAIHGYRGHPVVEAALQLAPLVFVRPGELRAAEWSEVDLESGEWRIAAHRTKMRQPHLVPLSRQAAAILREIEPLTGHGRYVFPSPRSAQRPLSDNAVTAALRRMGYTGEPESRIAARLLLSHEVRHGDVLPGTRPIAGSARSQSFARRGTTATFRLNQTTVNGRLARHRTGDGSDFR